jgi:hypothetical protein
MQREGKPIGRGIAGQVARVAAALFVAAALASLAVACGDDDDETTVTEQETSATVTETTGTTTTPTTTTGTTTTPTTTGTTTTSGGVTPADCDADQVFSKSSGTCVAINTGGGNPCPSGEVPMADRPVCVPKN